jgi:ATP-dependent Clp protease adapter protein ClpS
METANPFWKSADTLIPNTIHLPAYGWLEFIWRASALASCLEIFEVCMPVLIVVAPANGAAIAPEPPRYGVVLRNDDTTFPSFVVKVLSEVFRSDNAVNLVIEAHHRGSAVVFTNTKDVCYTLVDKANNMIAAAEPGKHFSPKVEKCELTFNVIVL